MLCGVCLRENKQSQTGDNLVFKLTDAQCKRKTLKCLFFFSWQINSPKIIKWHFLAKLILIFYLQFEWKVTVCLCDTSSCCTVIGCCLFRVSHLKPADMSVTAANEFTMCMMSHCNKRLSSNFMPTWGSLSQISTFSMGWMNHHKIQAVRTWLNLNLNPTHTQTGLQEEPDGI